MDSEAQKLIKSHYRILDKKKFKGKNYSTFVTGFHVRKIVSLSFACGLFFLKLSSASDWVVHTK